MAMSFEKLPPVEGGVVYLNCGCGPKNELNMERRLCVGFGTAGYSLDGETIWQESPHDEFEDAPQVSLVEKLAQESPDCDWRIFFHAPLYDAVYQRQGDGIWVLVEKGLGFA